MTTTRPPRFVPVIGPQRHGRLTLAGRAERARAGGGVSGDGLWREHGRDDGGLLLLLIDIEGKGPDTQPLRELIEMALDDAATWGLNPGELLVELHSQAAAVWADAAPRHQRDFHAQAVLVLPERGHFFLASAAIPNPCLAASLTWEVIDAPSASVGLLGRPDVHDEGEPVFPDRRFEVTAGARYLAGTDGVTEAGRPKVLGSAGLLALLNGMSDRPEPDELLRRVFALAAGRDGPSWPGDDCTAVAWRLE